MNKNSWKIRFLVWVAKHIVRVPIIVDFTPADMENIYALGFAWSPAAANRMRGDDMIVERLHRAERLAETATGSRKARRVMNRAAKRAAERALKS